MIEFCQWDSIGSAVGDCDFPTSLQNIQVCSTGLEKSSFQGAESTFSGPWLTFSFSPKDNAVIKGKTT